MDKLTTALVAAAVALGLLATRDARRSDKRATGAQHAGRSTSTPSPRPASRPADNGMAIRRNEPIDKGMAILRNEPIDDGMIVRSPFKGEPGSAEPENGGN